MSTIKKKKTSAVLKKTATKKAPVKKLVKKAPIKKAVKNIPVKAVKKKTSAVLKKTASKKAPAKRGASAKAKKPLVLAPNEKSFWVTNGEVLNSLLALRDALNRMEREVYSYHVSNEHNDFASWVDDVLCDAQCAKDLAKATDPAKAKTAVVRHLKVYSV